MCTCMVVTAIVGVVVVVVSVACMSSTIEIIVNVNLAGIVIYTSFIPIEEL